MKTKKKREETQEKTTKSIPILGELSISRAR
jgi:hypothetical protein